MDGEFPVLQLLSLTCLLVTLLAATLTDVVSHRIPNALLAPALLAAFMLSIISSGAQGLLISIGGLCVGLAMLLPLYAMGVMGAGDVKLLGVAGAFLGPFNTLIAGLATFIAGAVFGLLYIVWKNMRSGRFADTNFADTNYAAWVPGIFLWLVRLLQTTESPGAVATREAARRRSTFAYAPAILVGTLAALWARQWPIVFSIG